MRLIPGIFIIVLLFSLVSCEGGKRKEMRGQEAKFTTSDASELFFKNVRAIQYDKVSMDEAKLDIYRIKDRVEGEDEPVLNVSIVINWRFDEAYVLTEPNAPLQDMDTLRIMWQDTVRNDSGVYQFSNGNKEAHFSLATQLYRNLQNQQALYLLRDEQKIPLMRDKKSREAFRKTMVDYLRLVDLL